MAVTKKAQLSFAGLFDVNDVAGITGLSRETIRRYCRLGLVAHATFPGGEYRFSDDQVEALLTQHPARRSKVRA